MEVQQYHASEETENRPVAGTNKTHKGHHTREMLLLVILGITCIGGIGTGVYFAVESKPTDDDVIPANNKMEGDQQEASQPAYMYDMEALDIELNRRFDVFFCEQENINSFVIGNNYYYVFTDHPSEFFMVNACKKKFTSAVNMSGHFGFYLYYIDTIVRDFETCCLNYFEYADPIWWDSLNKFTQQLANRPLTLNYVEDLERWDRVSNGTMRPHEIFFRCEVAWDDFDPYWEELNCLHQPTYTHMCVVTDI